MIIYRLGKTVNKIQRHSISKTKFVEHEIVGFKTYLGLTARTNKRLMGPMHNLVI